MDDLIASGQPPAITPDEVLRAALIDSRQRWRELVNLSADFAFETDEWGRFTLISPDPALGWPAAALIGEVATSLLADGGASAFDPFRVTSAIRHRTAWLKRGDGGVVCITFCAAPIRDAGGRVRGARGSGLDVTELDDQAAQAAGALRRADLVDHILWRMAQEVVTARMMDGALGIVASAMGAEGAAVLFAAPDPEPAGAPENSLGQDGLPAGADLTADCRVDLVAYVTGTGIEAVADAAGSQVVGDVRPPFTICADRRPVLISVCRTRFGQTAGVVAWRLPDAREWDAEDKQILASATSLIRMILEREATQTDMARQARTDPLTGLLNRRAFLEELDRHAARQDRDHLPGTLIFADLDNFKPVNDRLGHEIGDEVLRCTAALLRKTFRPTDLIARLGGDEFAVWLNGADHMTAAERAEFLRDAVPRELAEVTGPDGPRVSLSIGIASREPGDGEPIDNLMRRADRAMYEVKRGGRGHWRVSLRNHP
jgi:diguanylate cyclase (GGDEF)-like protein/PAS domain S-box-containing protein